MGGLARALTFTTASARLSADAFTATTLDALEQGKTLILRGVRYFGTQDFGKYQQT